MQHPHHIHHLPSLPIDFPRLGRALTLHAERVGEGRYLVHTMSKQGVRTHWVDLYSPDHPRCDCGDHLWRETVCKHILAALLREGNEGVIQSLGAMFAALQGEPHSAAA